MNQENQEGTVVGANVKLSGTISDNNDIIIHGTVEGEVISEKNINITPSATVKGPVRGQIITIAGEVDGDVAGIEKTELLPTGKINGSITTKELIIQSGAIFNGKCAMDGTPIKETANKKQEQKNTSDEEKQKASDKDEKQEKKNETDLDDFELE